MPLRYTLALVVATRLLVLLLLKPGGGLIDSIGDFPFYRALAELTLERRPFLDFWVEYPPLFPWVLELLYRLALRLPGWPSAPAPFQLTFGGFLLACDLGNVFLVRRLAARLHGPALADRAAALYALQPFALLCGFAWFDAFPLFFLLLALDAALADRAWLAGLALGLGGLAKLIPVVVAPAVMRALGTRRRVALAAAAGAAVVALAIAPLALSRSPFVAASLRATLVNRSAWETVWALLEGYWGVGTVAPIRDRTLVEAASRLLHPASLPWTAITAVQALLVAALCVVPRRWRDARGVVAVATLALYVFLLLSRGYSPQFLLYQLPLLVALWPDRRGLAYTLALTALGLLEWPIVMSLFPDRHELIALVIVARTALWLVICADVLVGLARPARLTALGGAIAAGLALAVLAAGHLADRGEHAPVVAYLRALGADGAGPLLASTRTAFYRFAPALGSDRVALAVDDLDPSPAARLTRLRARADAPAYWLVLDNSEGDPAWRDRLEHELAGLGSRATDRWFGYYHLVGFVRPEAWRADPRFRPVEAIFGDQLALAAWLPSADRLTADRPLRLLFAWRVLAQPTRDYKLFVHLLDDRTEQILAQDDRPLEDHGRPATGWAGGETTLTALEPIAPASAPGAVRLRIGLYDPASGARLPVGAGDHLDLAPAFSGVEPPDPAG